MATRNKKAVLAQMKLTDEAVGVIISNYGQGLITIFYFSQLNDKSLEGICRFWKRPGETTGGVSNTGVVVSEIYEANLQGMFITSNLSR